MAPPTNTSATVVSTTRIDLAWDDNSDDETGFRIERSTDCETFLELAVVSDNITLYSDTSVSEGNTYCYRIRAIYNEGDSRYLITVKAITDFTPPGTPTDPAIDLAWDTQIDLSWQAPVDDDVAGYRIYRDQALANTVSGKENTIYSDIGLTPDTEYFYTISAIDFAENESAQTLPISETTKSEGIIFENLLPADSSTLSSPVTFSADVRSLNKIKGATLYGNWSGAWQEEGYENFEYGDEMLVNGDFETFTDGIADNWAPWDDGAIEYTLSRDTGHIGFAQKIHVTSAGNWGVFYFQEPPFEYGKEYEWTFWYKTTGSNGLHAAICNPEHSQVVSLSSSSDIPGTNGSWQEKAYAFTWNNSLATQLRVGTNSVEDYLIDEFSLRETIPGQIRIEVSFEESIPAGSYSWELKAEDAEGNILSGGILSFEVTSE